MAPIGRTVDSFVPLGDRQQRAATTPTTPGPKHGCMANLLWAGAGPGPVMASARNQLHTTEAQTGRDGGVGSGRMTGEDPAGYPPSPAQAQAQVKT